MKTRIFSLFSMLLLLVSPVYGTEETITLMDGQDIRVLYFEPEGADEETPLAVLLAAGPSNRFMARAQFWLGKELVIRGWAIAVPISPGGRNYFTEHASQFPELITHIQRAHQLEAGKALLVGISTGGSAALSIAAHDPDQYMGVVATPGRPDDDLDPGSLNGLPVYLRIGDRDDFRWNRSMDNIIQRLTTAGALVDAQIVPAARHIFPLNWDDLEIWLDAAQRRP